MPGSSCMPDSFAVGGESFRFLHIFLMQLLSCTALEGTSLGSTFLQMDMPGHFWTQPSTACGWRFRQHTPQRSKATKAMPAPKPAYMPPAAAPPPASASGSGVGLLSVVAGGFGLGFLKAVVTDVELLVVETVVVSVAVVVVGVVVTVANTVSAAENSAMLVLLMP